MNIEELFINQLEINYKLIKENKYQISFIWLNPQKLPENRIMIGLYPFKRQYHDKYITFVYPKENQKEYFFDFECVKGIYEIRICSYSFGLKIFDYELKYRSDPFFVGTENDKNFKIEVVPKIEQSQILIKINQPAEKGDFIGMFEENTFSMKDNYMIGIKKIEFGESVLERYFDVDLHQIDKEKKYQIRYFKFDSDLTFKLSSDIARIPFCISQSFELQ